MLSIFLGILTFGLVVVSLFLILVVLAQKAKSDGGVGAAMGGGMAEAAFGADTSNVLSRTTRWAAVFFFTFALVLFLGRIYEQNHGGSGSSLLNAAEGNIRSAAPKASPTLPLSAPATPAPDVPGSTAPAAPAAPTMGTETPAPAAPAAPAKQP